LAEEQNMETKLTKQETNYRPADDQSRRCGSCINYDAPDKCTLVEGIIAESATCDLWEQAQDIGQAPSLEDQLFLPPTGGLPNA